MKIRNLLIISTLFVFILSSCGQSVNTNVKLKSDLDSVSYALGIDIAKSLERGYVDELNYNAFIKGIEDVFNEEDFDIADDQSKQIIQKYFKQLRDTKIAQNLEEGRTFLDENKSKENIDVTESGLQYEIIKEGEGIAPAETDTVVVHYRGTLIDGTEFDSSYEKGKPARFPLNGVIPGWTEGLQLMKEGANYKLYIPTELGYGVRVRPGGVLEPNMALIFDVELIEVIKGPESTEE
ncbi:MAG TPA: FKBP-type peptidyl-prolyl cis-trans isomerase [Bacteroidales bacterium]|nr:FKBP-type peptidyl-prolyl cis-trans isomerase [Bacteroidales bacterium]